MFENIQPQNMLFFRKIFNLKTFFRIWKTLMFEMFEGRMDKTVWQRPEFEANNPMFDKVPPKK